MDLQILQWINNNLHGNEVINNIFKYITYLGEKGILWIAIGVILLCIPKTRKTGFLLLISIGIGIVINNLMLKPIVARPRPFTQDESFVTFLKSIKYKLPTGYSFPSGHTQIAINAAVFLTLSYKGKGAISLIPALLISFSRVFLCVHYTTDVLVAAVVGMIVSTFVFFVGRIVLDKIINAIKNKMQKKTIEENQ